MKCWDRCWHARHCMSAMPTLGYTSHLSFQRLTFRTAGPPTHPAFPGPESKVGRPSPWTAVIILKLESLLLTDERDLSGRQSPGPHVGRRRVRLEVRAGREG